MEIVVAVVEIDRAAKPGGLGTVTVVVTVAIDVAPGDSGSQV